MIFGERRGAETQLSALGCVAAVHLNSSLPNRVICFVAYEHLIHLKNNNRPWFDKCYIGLFVAGFLKSLKLVERAVTLHR